MSDALLLFFDDEKEAAQRFAQAANLRSAVVERHRFPDGELKLRLPASLPPRVMVYRSLVNPNEKMLELLLLAAPNRAS